MTGADIIASLRGRLIVSCQAPFGSPLHDPYVIARMAIAAEQGGAVAVRIDSPDHIRAVRALCTVPIIRLHKQVHADSDVYITPTRTAAEDVVAAGADIVAVDATRRPRPGGESLEAVIGALRRGDGVDLLATTLSGYTADSTPRDGPDFDLVTALSRRAHVPVICEGRLRTTGDVRRAFDAGAFAAVVGRAITGIDGLVGEFVRATPFAGRTPGDA